MVSATGRNISLDAFLPYAVRNKLFAMDFSKSWENDFPCCDPLLDIWTLFPNINWFRERHFQSCGKAIVVTAVQEKIYVLPADTTILLKYNVYSQSWQTVSHFDWGSTEDACVVPSHKYLYAIGGQLISKHRKCLAEAANFDTSTKKWETASPCLWSIMSATDKKRPTIDRICSIREKGPPGAV